MNMDTIDIWVLTIGLPIVAWLIMMATSERSSARSLDCTYMRNWAGHNPTEGAIRK